MTWHWACSPLRFSSRFPLFFSYTTHRHQKLTRQTKSLYFMLFGRKACKLVFCCCCCIFSRVYIFIWVEFCCCIVSTSWFQRLFVCVCACVCVCPHRRQRRKEEEKNNTHSDQASKRRKCSLWICSRLRTWEREIKPHARSRSLYSKKRERHFKSRLGIQHNRTEHNSPTPKHNRFL